MPEMLEVGAVAPEFLLCDGDYRLKKPAVDINGEPISIRDFDDKCLVLMFIGEARAAEEVNPRIDYLKRISAFADECKKLGAEFVAIGMNELGMMQECVEKAEITFSYIPCDNHQTPVLHDYKAYGGHINPFTYIIVDGKIQQGWDQTPPKSFDGAHFQEVLTYISANNIA
jgi:peroxiredoxin